MLIHAGKSDFFLLSSSPAERFREVRFWTLFVAMAGLVMARVVDPVTAQQVVGVITGWGGKQEKERCIISFPTHIGFF
jgi:hypothetical protein